MQGWEAMATVKAYRADRAVYTVSLDGEGSKHGASKHCREADMRLAFPMGTMVRSQ